MSQHDLTALIAAASRAGAQRGWRCPDEVRLAAFVDGTLAGGVREAVAEHLADCAFCCGQVGFLARASELGPLPAVPAALLALVQGEHAPLVRRLRPAVALAAAVTVAAAALLLIGREHPWHPPGRFEPARATEAPQGAERTARNGLIPADAPQLLSPAEGEAVPRAALLLRWLPAPGALLYTVQIVDARGDVAFEGRTEGTMLVVPATAPLAPGRRYFAWVLAHLPSGATVRSPAVGFRLAPG
jgi:hypothetical protein